MSIEYLYSISLYPYCSQVLASLQKSEKEISLATPKIIEEIIPSVVGCEVTTNTYDSLWGRLKVLFSISKTIPNPHGFHEKYYRDDEYCDQYEYFHQYNERNHIAMIVGTPLGATIGSSFFRIQGYLKGSGDSYA